MLFRLVTVADCQRRYVTVPSVAEFPGVPFENKKELKLILAFFTYYFGQREIKLLATMTVIPVEMNLFWHFLV